MATVTIVQNASHENLQIITGPTNKTVRTSPKRSKSHSPVNVSHPDKATASSKVQSAHPIPALSSCQPDYSTSKHQSLYPSHHTTQTNDHDEIDMDLVIDSLETSEVDYQPTPSGLKSLIDKLCDKYHVDSPISFPSSTNSKDIHILGSGALKMKKELIRLASKEYCEYTLLIKDSGPLHTEQYRSSVQQKIGDEDTGVWTDGDYTFCDLVVSGNGENQEVPSPDRSLYAVTPAHLVLNDEQCSEVLSGRSPVAMKQMRKTINSNIHAERYFLRNQRTNGNGNCDVNVDLSHPTMISYRHYFSNISTPSIEENWVCSGGVCRSHEMKTCPHQHMNDIALLPIGPLKALTAEQQRILQNLRFDKIVPLEKDQLQKMIYNGSIIKIGTHKCKLVPHGNTHGQKPEKTYADHIVFRMADQERVTLNPGESGSILYLPYGNRRLAIAMFIGKIKDTEDQYQAILLSPALKDIELDYRLHVTGLSH